MESYIVRILWRGERKEGSLVGAVETIGSAESRSFRNKEELWQILNGENAHGEAVGPEKELVSKEPRW
jgi:hypothetical protein